jgi:hypothetical protein
MKENDANKLTEVFAGTPWEAELIKGLLESNGIQTALKDGILGTLAPYLSPEVAVFVSEQNYESAVTLINERENKKTDR